MPIVDADVSMQADSSASADGWTSYACVADCPADSSINCSGSMQYAAESSIQASSDLSPNLGFILEAIAGMTSDSASGDDSHVTWYGEASLQADSQTSPGLGYILSSAASLVADSSMSATPVERDSVIAHMAGDSSTTFAAELFLGLQCAIRTDSSFGVPLPQVIHYPPPNNPSTPMRISPPPRPSPPQVYTPHYGIKRR